MRDAGLKTPLGWLVAIPILATSIGAAVLFGGAIHLQEPGINFFGRVVDENQAPISGAAAHFQWSDSAGSMHQADARSDRDGRFTLRHRSGECLWVNVSKRGYYQYSEESFAAVSFKQASSPSGDGEPRLFRLRKAGPPAVLIHRGGVAKLAGDPPRARIPLGLASTNEPSPELEFEVWRDPERDSNLRYDWAFRVRIPQGGVVPWTSEFPGAAPADGYAPAAEIVMNARGSDWGYFIAPKYYFRCSPRPCYGRIQIERYGANEDQVRWQYWINPEGSRNLECAPVER